METLHKLAGVTEATDTNEQPSQPVPEPPPIPPDPEEDAKNDSPRPSNRASRASLPLNRQPSHKSIRSSRSRDNRPSPGVPPEHYPPLPSPSHFPPQRNQRTSDESARSGGSTSSDEFEWGPNHPCFPHPNPHCAPDSDEQKSTRVIRVKRDWLQAGDLYPQYANLYPEILDPLVSDEDFRFLISNLNARLRAAFDPGTARAWADALLGAVTGFIWDDLGLTGSKKGLKGLEAFIEEWNAKKVREGKEVRVVQLRRTGFMALDFVVPDPEIDEAEPGGEEGMGVEEGGIGPAE